MPMFRSVNQRACVDHWKTSAAAGTAVKPSMRLSFEGRTRLLDRQRHRQHPHRAQELQPDARRQSQTRAPPAATASTGARTAARPGRRTSPSASDVRPHVAQLGSMRGASWPSRSCTSPRERVSARGRASARRRRRQPLAALRQGGAVELPAAQPIDGRQLVAGDAAQVPLELDRARGSRWPARRRTRASPAPSRSRRARPWRRAAGSARWRPRRVAHGEQQESEADTREHRVILSPAEQIDVADERLAQLHRERLRSQPDVPERAHVASGSAASSCDRLAVAVAARSRRCRASSAPTRRRRAASSANSADNVVGAFDRPRARP